MNLYQLEHKKQDEAFLEHKVVTCRFALPERTTLNAGSLIVVRLSDRRKYKGKIVALTYDPKSGNRAGTIDLQRE